MWSKCSCGWLIRAIHFEKRCHNSATDWGQSERMKHQEGSTTSTVSTMHLILARMNESVCDVNALLPIDDKCVCVHTRVSHVSQNAITYWLMFQFHLNFEWSMVIAYTKVRKYTRSENDGKGNLEWDR